MKKMVNVLVAFLMVVSGNVFSQGPFPPAAGVEGSTAIAKNSDAIVGWATGVQLLRGEGIITEPGTVVVDFGFPSASLHEAQGNSLEVVSLGDAGMATLTFNRPIINGPGFDFAVFENSFSDNFLELAFVEVSSDGHNFVRFPSVSLTQTEQQIDGFGTVDPTYINNLAGKYRQGFGTPFDLSELENVSKDIDLNNIRFVRIIDAVGCIQEGFATYDSQGNIVNDPWPTPFNSSGFDLDGVAIINGGTPYSTSDFNDLSLDHASHWDGSDGSGKFTSGNVEYVNNYNPDYFSWSGFAYSNDTNNTSTDYTNQFSAMTKGGMDADENFGTNYGVAYVASDFMSGTYDPIPSEANFVGPEDEALYYVNGLYVTNATLPYLSMLNGDAYAKKFGGETGNDPDWFKLMIYGIDEDGNNTDTVEFFLADYRFEDNSSDYIVSDWQWVELSSLGAVKGLRFFLQSSDRGDYGMNTPAYFCIDNLYLKNAKDDGIKQRVVDINASLYPNPCADKLTVNVDVDCSVEIFNQLGELMCKTLQSGETAVYDVSDYPNGLYLVRMVSDNKVLTKKFVKM